MTTAWIRGRLLLATWAVLITACTGGQAAPPPSPTPPPSPSGGARLVLSGEVCRAMAGEGRVRVGTFHKGQVAGCPSPAVLRGFLVFRLGGLSARQRGVWVLSSSRFQVGLPYAVTRQVLLVEVLDWSEGRGLKPEDFDRGVVAGTGPLIAARSDGEELEVDVTDLVGAALRAGLQFVGFRFRFSVEPTPPGTLDQVEHLVPPFSLQQR